MSRRLKLAFVLVTLLLFFQNCSQFKSDSQGRGTSFKFANNGGSYGGKLSGTFYRFAPEFSCESNAAPTAFIEITATTIRLINNTDQRCAAATQDLTLQDLDRSIYQSFLIGYQDGIYEGLDYTPASIPADLVEVWCRNRDDHTGVETIMHYDRDSRRAVQRIYHSREDSTGTYTPQMIPDFPVARVLTSNSVQIRDDKGFELIVHRDQPSSKLGLFIGQMTAVIDGHQVAQETYCRLGGSLDPDIWPGQQITQQGLYPDNLGISPDGRYLAFTTRSFALGRQLYVARADGSQPLSAHSPDVTPVIIGGGIAQAVFSEDSKSLILHGNINHDPPTNDSVLLKWDLVQSPGTGPQTLLALDHKLLLSFALSGDQTSLVYEYDTNQPYSYTSRLKAMDLETKATHEITPPAAGRLTRGVIGGFGVSKSLNKISYLWDASSSVDSPLLDYYVVNNDGTALTKISPRLPSPDWKLLHPERGFNVPNGGNYMMARAMHSTTNEIRYYALALDGSGTIELPPGWNWSFLSPSSRFALLTASIPPETGVTTTQALLMDLKTGTRFPLPPLKTISHLDYSGQMEISLPISTAVTATIDGRLPNHPSLFFTSDSSRLIGRSPVPAGGYRAIAVSTADGRVQDLCPGLVSEDLWFQSLASDRILIATYNIQTQFIDIYLHQENLECKKVNSLLSANSSLQAIREITVSPDNQKLLVRLSRRVSNEAVTTHIFYVPLNGLPAHLVNSTLTESAIARTAVFAADSQRVILLANQSTGSEMSVFIWTAPDR